MACARRLKTFAIYHADEEAEERRLGVSTKLKLYTDPFDVKKVLKKSDVDGLSRLMLPTRVVQERILVKWDEKRVAEANSCEGARVRVWDVDTSSEHQLTLKRWSSNGSFVLTSNWVVNFVERRKLKEGDEIGMFWSSLGSMFYFRVVPKPYCAGVKYF